LDILNEVPINCPIGTLDELKEIGADPKKIPSCHERTKDGSIKGCVHHRVCRFRQWRDGVGGLKGPLNIGVEITLAQVDGRHTGQMEMACYQYYNNNTRARQKQQDDTGELIRIVAYEGDGRSIVERCTRHPEGEPKTSPLMEHYDDIHEVRPHLRPKERFPIVAAAHIATEERMDDLERETLKNALAKHGISPAKADVAREDVPAPVVGEPVRVGKK
jgi:hypothetical protein